MSRPGSERSVGGLDVWLESTISGWARPGATVRVTLDEAALGEGRAEAERLFPLRRPGDARCGFSLPAPARLFDGGEHVLRAFDVERGLELTGSPLRFRSRAAAGRIGGVDGNIVRGEVADPGDPGRRVVVAALSGSETVALAASEADGRFALILPEDLLRTGAGFLHVAVLGSDVLLEGGPVLLPAAAVAPLALRPARPRPTTAAIKISAPNLRVAHEWGDYHFANALQAALQRRGWLARVDCHDAWARTGDEVVIALRGRHRYKPDPGVISLLWIISHPDRLSRGEADTFDHVFVAASPYAKTLARTTDTPVQVLHQATDPAVFEGSDPVETPSPVLFVGNSRREHRRMVRWSVEQGLDLTVYGTLWRGLIPERMIGGEHIANEDLHRWYAGAGVVLNDHWDTMLSGGFLSNRLFDASAAGAVVITDPVAGLAEVFGDTIETAEDGPELADKVRACLAEPERARAKATAAQAIVRAGHTFDHRAEFIVATVEQIRRTRATAG